MNNTTIIEDQGAKSDLASNILIEILMLAFFSIGTVLHIKIIKVSKKEKDLTWQIDITNSVLVIFCFANVILIHLLTHWVEDLHQYTGQWLCYTFKVIIHYSLLFNGGQSAVVSIMKYIILVHDERFRHLKDELKKTFFWINILHPVFYIILHLVLVPDFYVVYGGFSSVNTCLGTIKSDYEKTKWWQLCDFWEDLDTQSISYTMFVVKSLVCKTQVILIYIIQYNFLEIFFYTRIFSSMKRKILPSGGKNNGNTAARLLSQSTNDRNARKLQVNSQVTAFVTGTESLYTILYTVVLILVKEKTALVTVVPRMCLFCVLLPYVFLMNTSHNKNRIAEVGWKNILRNILGWYNETLIVSINDNNNLHNNDDKKNGTSKETTNLSSQTNRNNRLQERNSQGRMNNSMNKDIFTISGVNNGTNVDTNSHIILPNSTFDEEVGCSSKTLENPEAVKNIFDAVKEMNDVYVRSANIAWEKRRSSEDSYQSETLEDVMKEQISYMIKCLKENEELYVIHFQNLVEFHSRCKAGESPTRCKNRLFEDQPRVNPNNIAKNRSDVKVKTKTTKSKSSKSFDTLTKNSTKASNPIPSECPDFIKSKLEMKAEREERITMRVELLTKLHTCHDNDKKEFETLFNLLMDLEENLLH